MKLQQDYYRTKRKSRLYCRAVCYLSLSLSDYNHKLILIIMKKTIFASLTILTFSAPDVLLQQCSQAGESASPRCHVRFQTGSFRPTDQGSRRSFLCTSLPDRPDQRVRMGERIAVPKDCNRD